MSARKKTSKSSSKKSEESASKSKSASLLALLKQKASPYRDTPEVGSLTAEVLEALLEKGSSKLDNLLAQWGHDAEAVRHVVANLVESKIPLFAQRMAELLEKDQGKLYLYPWLEEIYAKYHNVIAEEISEKLEKNLVIEQGETEKLIKLQGKLSLILQQ